MIGAWIITHLLCFVFLYDFLHSERKNHRERELEIKISRLPSCVIFIFNCLCAGCWTEISVLEVGERYLCWMLDRDLCAGCWTEISVLDVGQRSLGWFLALSLLDIKLTFPLELFSLIYCALKLFEIGCEVCFIQYSMLPFLFQNHSMVQLKMRHTE